MIYLISRENIHLLEVVTPALSRAFGKTRLGLFWSMEKLHDSVVNQEVWVFHQPDTGFAGVFNIGYSPNMKYLNWFWSGQDLSYEVTPNYGEVQELLEYCARTLGLSYITTEGRRGWTPLAKKHGYEVDSILFIKEVPHVELQPSSSTTEGE